MTTPIGYTTWGPTSGRGALRPHQVLAVNDLGDDCQSDREVYAIGPDGSLTLLRSPKDVHIVTESGHPLSQRRIATAPEWMVESIMERGVVENIIVTGGPMADRKVRLDVVDGRRRVESAREANRRFEAQGQAPTIMLKVSIVGVSLLSPPRVEKSDVQTLLDLMESLEPPA